MNNILFVDDEPEVLRGLRDSLRKYRHDWNMTFVSSGAEALAALAAAPFDVVVSDIRMPRMDGTALLGRIKIEYPRTARIILSGQADKDAIVRALPVTHQFVAKPCDPEQLRRVIERTCGLNGLMGNEAIRLLVGGLEKLPSVPSTYLALTQAMARDEVKISEVAAIVERDAAMSIKVLQLVNSAYFGTAQRMTSIRHAATYLGLELLRALALSAHVFGALDGAALQHYGLGQVQDGSMLTARLARRFLSASGRGEVGFTAGLIHDIGRVVLATCLEDDYLDVVERSRRDGVPLHLVEREMLKVTHAEVGAYLLGIWGLPPAIVEAIAFHHAPGSLPHDDSDIAGAVHVADILVEESMGSPGRVAVGQAIDPAYLDQDGVAAKLALWRHMGVEELSRTCT